jgi:hypothetical protein
MKKTAFCLMILLNVIYLTSCTPLVQHSDPFYNVSDSDYAQLPLIDPIEARKLNSSSPWELDLANYLWINLPNSQDVYAYSHVDELEKVSVGDGVIMAYSSYVDKQADAYIQDNYYHWFVMVPSKNITVGFHTEDEFLQYIQTLGVQDPVWQTPDKAYAKFEKTGCLDWIPDCK